MELECKCKLRNWPNVQRISPLVKRAAFDQMRAHLANCAARLPKCAAHLVNPTAVSYTHLTLPTIYSV